MARLTIYACLAAAAAGAALAWSFQAARLGAELADERLQAIRITKLDEFIQRNALFRQLESAEQSRMRRQLDVMRELSVILGERISAF